MKKYFHHGEKKLTQGVVALALMLTAVFAIGGAISARLTDFSTRRKIIIPAY